MSSMNRVGIGLGVVFGCFVLALMVKIYCVFWWRKRLNSAVAQEQQHEEQDEDAYICRSPSKELFYLFCWRKQGSMSSRALNTNASSESVDSRIINFEGDAHVVLTTSPESSPVHPEFVNKVLAEGMDAELMRIHGLLGPPRILFTIKEETKEDMESEDGRSKKSKRGSHSRSFSDLLSQIGSETGGFPMISSPSDSAPFITPSSSPPFNTPFTTPPLTPLHHSPPYKLNYNSYPAAAAADLSLSSGYPNTDENLSKAGTANLAVGTDDDGSLSNSPTLSGDENASFITIFVNNDSYKFKS
ncbi:hypothetical protein SUGI_1191290 [Cryptomeria japonica]|uniref:uncharacterized protein LOC131063149 n=1 Tax=Cryptomeria japonica TaxID=3369 RepID=UPI0024149120|nr:uncharacterized protein LOC131063149 [Cryptomeria japonica]GLJ55476.1 hypothetical protein SUGI_1191290 [Cryptomeria japonica]